MSVKQARREIDSREFMQWQVYYHKEPFGLYPMEVQTANIADMVANSCGAKTTLNDHMFFSGKKDKSPEQQSVKDMEKVMMKAQAVTAAYNVGGKK